MENKFFTFINPYLHFIDSGNFFRKPFSWLYMIIAILNLLAPLYYLYWGISNNIFDAKGGMIVAFFLIFLIVAFAGWISFQLWWDRKEKVIKSTQEGDDFIAIPVYSHFVQTFGEWLGTYVAIVGFLCALIIPLIAGEEGRYIANSLGGGLSILGGGLVYAILIPIYGFLIVVIARVIAEIIRALAAIANNTKRIQ